MSYNIKLHIHLANNNSWHETLSLTFARKQIEAIDLIFQTGHFVVLFFTGF